MAFRLGMGDEAFADYGWRFPFMLSRAAGNSLRLFAVEARRVAALQALKDQGKSSDNPARDAYGSGKNWRLMLLALFGFTAPEGVVWYTGQFYALAYMQTVLKIPVCDRLHGDDGSTCFRRAILCLLGLAVGPFWVAAGS